ncbi:MAG: hypothetical protein ACXWOL_16920 [Ktedonobacteraceae bacterium]
MIIREAHTDDIAGIAKVHVETCRFYEALGGNLVRMAQFEIGGLMLDEVVYGWMDIRKLLQD